MAEHSELETMACLVWSTERPTTESRKSSCFTLLDSEWYFELEHSRRRGRNVYAMYLMEGTKIKRLKKPFTVHIFIGNVFGYGSVALEFMENISSINQSICEFAEEEVPCVQNVPGLRIVCLFYGLKSDVMQAKKQTIRLLDLDWRDFDLESLSLDFSNLLKSDVPLDVKLRCGDLTVPAHRAVLAARSEVFAAMFRNEMVESVTGVVEIEDMEPQVLDLFLKYLYSGKLEDLPEDILPGLYMAGDKYAVDALKKACSGRMIRSVTEINFLSLLKLGDMHSDVALKEASISFICNNEAVFKSKDWLEFIKEPSKLAMEVYQKFAISKNDLNVVYRKMLG